MLRRLGDSAGAESLIARALAIDEAALGANHPDVAIDLNNLGEVLRARGDLAEAKSLFDRALLLMKRRSVLVIRTLRSSPTISASC